MLSADAGVRFTAERTTMSAITRHSGTTDKDILGYSRYRVVTAAFFAMLVISPFEYAWSSISGKIGAVYGWSDSQTSTMFSLFVVFQAVGMLPGGLLRDRFGPRWTTAIAGVLSALGIFSVTLGPNYGLVLVLWCIGSFFTGFIYNDAVTTGNKWFPDRRGLMTGIIAGAFSWGSIPFIFWTRAIPKSAPESDFFTVIYVMAAVLLVVPLVAAIFLKDPPKGWAPPRWEPKKATKRPNDREFTLSRALGTWQLWALIVSFMLISGAGLAGMSRIVQYSSSFGFAATVGTAAAAGISIANGLGKLGLGWVSERVGLENTMIGSYVLSGLLLLGSVAAGTFGSEFLFIVTAILSIFFWASLFSLFPITIGKYYGNAAAGANYGLLYAIAKGTGGVYGGILTAVLISNHGFSFSMSVAGVLAIVAGLVIIPLKFFPVMRRGRKVGELELADDGRPAAEPLVLNATLDDSEGQ
jgi:OFA family oxalate/formate antiporter-like MFS transporter